MIIESLSWQKINTWNVYLIVGPDILRKQTDLQKSTMKVHQKCTNVDQGPKFFTQYFQNKAHDTVKKHTSQLRIIKEKNDAELVIQD